MADTDYISVRRLRTFLAQMKQWVLGFTANRNTQTMSDVTKDTGISGTVAIGKSITIHTASGAQTANVMNADMITNTEPSSNKDKVTKAPTYDLMENTVMTAISDAFDDITTIEYQVINNASQLPATGTNGVIYLAAIYSEVENPTGNPHDLGYFVREDESDESDDGIVTYVLTTDTSVQSGTTYYKKEDAYDEYIWLTPENRYEKLGQASIDISGLKFAGSATSGGSAYKTGAIPFGRVDSTSTSTDIKATVEGIDRLEDGTCVMLRNNVVTSAAGFTININGLGAHPSFNNMTNTTRDTTIFNINYTMLFVYDAEREVDGVTGAWCCYRGYNTNDNTIGYQVRTNSSTLPAKFKTYRYRLYFTSAEGTHWVGANASTSTNATSSRTPTSEKINPFGPIIYYSTNGTTNANANLTATTIWQQYTVTLGYSFNHTGAALVLEYPKPVYLKCTPQSDGSVKIAGSSTVASYVQELPTTEDGFVYIFLGIAYAATTMELRLEHPVYYFKDGAIRLWSNQADAEVEIKKYNYDRDESDEGTADYGQTDIIVNGDTSTIISTQAPPSAVRQYIAPSWRAMNQKLAEKADADDVPHNLHVTLTSSTSGNVTTYTADHTHAEITAALASGGIVDVEHESYLYDFDGDVDGEIYFRRVTTQSVSGGASDNVYEHLFLVRVVNDEDKWTKESDNPIISNASTSRTGVVQLNDAVNSTSTTQAATANAVKKVKDAIPTKTSDLNNDSGFITSHQDISGKANKANQGIADEPLAEQHSSTYDATIAAQIKIDTNSGSQSANVVQHDMVTGSITGIVNTDKTKIPTSAAVAQYVSTHSAQADWDESDESDASFIQNKPDLTVYVKHGNTQSSNGSGTCSYADSFGSINFYSTGPITYTVAPNQKISFDSQDSTMGYIVKASGTSDGTNQAILASKANGDVEWFNDTGSSVTIRFASATNNENYSYTIVDCGYDDTIEHVYDKIGDVVQSVEITQTASGNDPGTTISVNGATPNPIVKDNEPGGSSNASVAPSWGAMKEAISDKVDKVSSTDNAVVRFNGTGGAIQNSGVTINDNNHVSAVKFISYGGTSNNFVKGDGSLDSSAYVKEGMWMMPTNAFGGSSKAIQINLINNGFYAADKRATVTLSGFTAGAAYQLFDGNYETALTLPAGSTGVITIDSGNTPLFGSYCYGYTYVSFYYNNMPQSVSMRVYGTRSSGGEAWYDLGSAAAFYNSAGAYCYRIYNSGTYSCKKWEITIVAKSDTIAKPTQIDHQFTRGATAYMSVVTKFALKQDLYGDVEAPKFIVRGGTSSQFLKADGSVDSNTYLTSHQDISGKVDKVDGKGLSTNDYTTADKTKLAGISEGAEVNVQSNWNETNSSSDAYIQNKPTIPTALADLTEDSSHKVVSQTSITTWNDKAEKVAQINHGTSDTTYTITPNVLHVWGEVTSLNLTLGTGESGVVNEYMFQFYSGNTPTTLTLPNSVIWVQPLTTQAGKTYQVSIVNNLACYITDGMAAAESSGGAPTYATQAWVTSLIDSVPTANSSNVPSSGGTYAMIEGGYYYE